jgi:hypothetical protein
VAGCSWLRACSRLCDPREIQRSAAQATPPAERRAGAPGSGRHTEFAVASGAGAPSSKFHASMDDLAATLTSQSASAVTVRQVVIVPAGEPPSTASAVATLAPGESLMVPLEEFTPRLSSGARPRSIRVITDSETLSLALAVP